MLQFVANCLLHTNILVDIMFVFMSITQRSSSLFMDPEIPVPDSTQVTQVTQVVVFCFLSLDPNSIWDIAWLCYQEQGTQRQMQLCCGPTFYQARLLQLYYFSCTTISRLVLGLPSLNQHSCSLGHLKISWENDYRLWSAQKRKGPRNHLYLYVFSNAMYSQC